MADFLDEMLSSPEPATPEPEAAPAPVEQPVEASAPEPTPEPEPAPTPEPAPQSEDQRVPLATFLDTRDELRQLKREKAEREAREREAAARPTQDDDPHVWASHVERQVNERLVQERFAMSDTMARQTHGAETVEKAVGWAQERAQADPTFAASYMRQQHPIDWIVQQHKRDALLTDIGDPSKLDDWFAREAAKRGYAMPSAAPAAVPGNPPVMAAPQPAAKPAQPPRSLASQSGNGPPAAIDDPTAAFNAIFDKRAG